MAPTRICATDFWPTFSLDTGLVRYLLEQALGELVVVSQPREADVVLTSVFTHKPAQFPLKSIAVIWENVRPNYHFYRYSISSDVDSYGGRNCRVPWWYAHLQWPGYCAQSRVPNPENHGYEPPVEIDSLLRPSLALAEPPRQRFCCFVAGNPEPYRMWSAERLSAIDKVDLFGNVAGRPLQTSKYEILPRYRFNLCFENSIFPGYYTEKPLQAWAAGCIPLYFSDPWYTMDFNPRAMINRIDFASLDEFAAHVAAVNASPQRQAAILEQPLLPQCPSLEPAVAFLRRAVADILQSG